MPKETFDSLQRALFFITLSGATALFLWIMWPFVMSVFWAIILAILLYPVYILLRRSVKSPSLSALLTIFAALVVVCVPLYLVGTLAVQEGFDMYHKITAGEINTEAITQNAYVEKSLHAFGINPQTVASDIKDLAQNASTLVATRALGAGIATLDFALKAAIALYLLFFFLKNGEDLLRYLMRLVPLGDAREKILFARFASTTRAVVKGTLIVSLAQGVVGGILFLIAGIHAPILWGAIMAVVATIPAVGPFIVWLPAGLILLAMGQIWQGIVVLLGGALIIGSIDNVLRPILVGRDIEMPDALVLLSILGGIATFGIAGLIIGPVIGALFLSIWDLFGKDFGEELSSRG